jgi:hypothetical protein
LIYLDDTLFVHHDDGTQLSKLDDSFKMKEVFIQVPTFYLGEKTVLPNGVVAWGMISSKYVQSAVQNVQEYLAELPSDNNMSNKASDMFAGGYTHEIDEIPELDPVMANLFQS